LSPTTTTPPRRDPREIWPPIGGDGPDEDHGVVDGVGIVELYASLKQGQSVKQWYVQHSHELANIDIRRFITFGIIKGFLYRVHKYAYATGLPAPVLKGPPHSAPVSRPHTRASSRVRTPTAGAGAANTPSTSSSVGDDAPISVGKREERSVGSDEDEDEEEFVDDKTLG
ncbi:nitrogen permease regulator, partial [Aspergillus sp. HF37]